ncbi:hypothetical protein LCGC14_2342910, partial [marine sediment metagenome]
AERALLREREQGREPGKLSWEMIEMARAFVEGKATSEKLDAARAAAWDAARAAALGAAWDAAWEAAWGAARYAVWGTAQDAARNAAQEAAIVDLIGQYGYTQTHHDLLTGPWKEVIGVWNGTEWEKER